MSDPWFKFFPSDWIAGVAGLSASERGVYVTLLALMYDNEGPISRDDARLSRICGLPKAGFTRAVEALLELEKLLISDGLLFNERAKNQLTERENRVNTAARGAKALWDKVEQNQSPSNAAAKPKQSSSPATRARLPEARVDIANAISKATPLTVLSGCLSEKTASDVVAHRKAKKAPLTVRAAELLAKAFVASGEPEAAAEMMIARGWAGFEVSWFEKEKTGGRSGKPSVQEVARRNCEIGVEFGPVPPVYMPSRHSEPEGRNPIVLLSEGGRGEPRDLRGGGGVGLVLLPGGNSLPSDRPEDGPSGHEPMATNGS